MKEYLGVKWLRFPKGLVRVSFLSNSLLLPDDSCNLFALA